MAVLANRSLITVRQAFGKRRHSRALLRDTPVLLLDEPTMGLDPATESRLVAGLLDATRGKTIVLVSHQPALIAQAERVVRLEAGRVSRAAPGWGCPLVASS